MARPPASNPSAPEPRPEPLPLRWAVILLAAVVAGVLVGALAAVHGDLAMAALAGLGAAGATTSGLHRLLP